MNIQQKPKQHIFLKSTGQEVHEMPWGGQDNRPWPQGYRRVVRRFLPHEGRAQPYTAEILIVRDCNLLFKS